MIDINKEYRTRDGREVKVLFTELNNYSHPVLYIMKNLNGLWEYETCSHNGRCNFDSHHYDLIEYNPQPNEQVDHLKQKLRDLFEQLNEDVSNLLK